MIGTQLGSKDDGKEHVAVAETTLAYRLKRVLSSHQPTLGTVPRHPHFQPYLSILRDVRQAS